MSTRRLTTSGSAWSWAAALALAVCAGVATAQQAPQKPLPDVSQTANGAPPHRSRLILKDGSYQIVMSYTIKGKIVSYVSAERGETEEMPADLVDWDATHKWERQHTADDSQSQPPAIDPELLKEEADRRSRSPPRSRPTSASPTRTASSRSTTSTARRNWCRWCSPTVT